METELNQFFEIKMNQIVQQIDALNDMGEAFADVRIEQDQCMMVKGPQGWCDVECTPSITDIHDFLSLVEPNWKAFLETEKEIDRSLSLGDKCRLRINAFTQSGGERLGMVIRRQSLNPIPLDQTGLPVHIEMMARAPSGLILVCGPTGSGKTTTLASMLDYINMTRTAHIVTIEQPIEYEFKPKNSVFTQREVGVDTKTFKDGVHAAMRQSPDVIMIGEIRDRDTCEAALRAALSGHLVLASTHGSRAVSAIQRMFSYFPDEPQFVSMALQGTLVGAVAQTLIQSTNGLNYVVAAEILDGRDPVVQEAIANPEKLRAIDEALKAGRVKGSNHFNAHLRQLVKEGRIEKSKALAASPALQELTQQLSDEPATV